MGIIELVCSIKRANDGGNLNNIGFLLLPRSSCTDEGNHQHVALPVLEAEKAGPRL